MRLEFGEDYFDRIKVETAWRLVQKPTAVLAKGYGSLFIAMRG